MKKTILLGSVVFSLAYPLLLRGQEAILADTLAVDSVSPMLSMSALAASADYSIDIPEAPYQTPEAAAFLKFGDINSTGFDGRADIRIPIMTVKDRDVEVPLELRYAGDGIRVAQEASWVGLGWDLCVGGSISLVVSGEYDTFCRLSRKLDPQGHTIQTNEYHYDCQQ